MGGTDGNEVEVMPSQRAKRHWSSFSWKSHIFRSSVMTDVLLYASCWPDIWETEFCCRIKGESFTFLKEQTNWTKCLFVFSNVKQEGWYHLRVFFFFTRSNSPTPAPAAHVKPIKKLVLWGLHAFRFPFFMLNYWYSGHRSILNTQVWKQYWSSHPTIWQKSKTSK